MKIKLKVRKKPEKAASNWYLMLPDTLSASFIIFSLNILLIGTSFNRKLFQKLDLHNLMQMFKI